MVRRPVSGTAERRLILFAAPDGKHANQLERTVSRQSDWRVCRVTTGDAVLRILPGSCDVLLLSTDLPVLSAFELCRIIRARPEIASLLIVVLELGDADDTRAERAFNCGADDYADIASGLPSLMSRIRSVLLRRTAPHIVSATVRGYEGQHLVARFDDVFVSVDAKPIRLQRLEFYLLRYLVQRKNQLVTREALLRDVWCGRSTLAGRTVDAHVCRLRRKLGVAGQQIQTLVSLGYRFVDESGHP
jgi:DNA-binding response OmpR family regulator